MSFEGKKKDLVESMSWNMKPSPEEKEKQIKILDRLITDYEREPGETTDSDGE